MNVFDQLSEILEKALAGCGKGADGPGDRGGNTLALADNLEFMRRLRAEGFDSSIDFIYVDPPFFTGSVRKGDSSEKSYGDKWQDLPQFLEMLAERLVLMRELLSDEGLIAVHLDYRTVHYVKLLMDGIFGSERLVNELIWTYKSGGAGSRSFARKHDTILLYSKGPDHYFDVPKEKSYNRGGRPYRFKGVEEFEDENGWYTLVNQKDVISMNMVGRTSKERTGYPTQKPLQLLTLLVSSCSKKSALCADFFCGSGTLPLAAHTLGRRFIACDCNPAAVETTKKRLLEAGAAFEELKL